MTDETPTTEPTPIRRRRTPRRRAATRTRRTESPGGIVAQLRSQLNGRVEECPCCHQPTGNKSQMAKDIGISVMTLGKFLKGQEVRSSTVDAVYVYLNKSE